MNSEERIASTQAWVRQHVPQREHALLLAEVAEVAHWSDEELAEWRTGLLENYESTMEMRSDLFPQLLSFEAWHRWTGYVLGQPMDEQTAYRTVWLWNYSVDAYAPYNPWMVEELAMLIVSHWEGYVKVFRDWQQRSKVAYEMGAPVRPTKDALAYWQHIGTSPLFGKLANDQSEVCGGPGDDD